MAAVRPGILPQGKRDEAQLWTELIPNEDQLHFGEQQGESARRSQELSGGCHKCHPLLTGIFILSNHSQTSPLELITFTQSSQLSCGFLPKSQKS